MIEEVAAETVTAGNNNDKQTLLDHNRGCIERRPLEGCFDHAPFLSLV
jgi:hypothetical protein